jgi:hypothetical protein
MRLYHTTRTVATCVHGTRFAMYGRYLWAPVVGEQRETTALSPRDNASMKKKAKPGSRSRNGYPTCVTTPKRIFKCIPPPCSSVEQKRSSILKQLIPAGPVYLSLAKYACITLSDPKSPTSAAESTETCESKSILHSKYITPLSPIKFSQPHPSQLKYSPSLLRNTLF